jgi:hypothetical protein
MNKYLYSAVCLAFLSCTSSSVNYKQINGHDVLVCDVSKIDSKAKQLLLSEIVDSIDFVRLETIDNSLIQRIKKVSVSEHYLGILDDGLGSKTYKLFTRQGDFVRMIGSTGQGPSEYIFLSDAQIDESMGKIYLMSFFNVNEILCYDLNGIAQASIPLGYKQLDKPKFFISDDTIICFQMPITNQSIYVFNQNLEGYVHNSIPATEHMYANNYDGEIFVTQNTGSMEIFYTAIDTLFHYDISKNKLTPVFCAEFGLPTIHAYNELPDYYLIWISGYPDKDKNILVNKKTLESFYYDFYNDFWEIPVQSYRFDNGYIILIYEAEEIKQLLNEKLSDNSSRIADKLKQKLKLADEMLIDDNPILMIGKLKK